MKTRRCLLCLLLAAAALLPGAAGTLDAEAHGPAVEIRHCGS